MTDDTDVIGATGATDAKDPTGQDNIKPNQQDNSVNPSPEQKINKSVLIDQLIKEIEQIKHDKSSTLQTNSITATVDINDQSTHNAASNDETVVNGGPSPQPSNVTKEDLIPINNIVKQLVSEPKRLNFNNILLNKELTLNMIKESPTEPITPELYKELVELLRKPDSANVDTSQSIENLINYDIFYTLHGTIGSNNGSDDLNYISINEISKALNTCPTIHDPNAIFNEIIDKPYNELSKNPDSLRQLLLTKNTNYSGKTFQLCIKINNKTTDNRESTLMRMTIFN